MEVELDKKKLQFTNDKGEKVRVDIDQDQTEKDEEVFERNHYTNLAEELDGREVAKIGKDLVRAYEDDKSSRKNWEDQYSKGLRMLGIVVEDRQDPFPGASVFIILYLQKQQHSFKLELLQKCFQQAVLLKHKLLEELQIKN